MLQYHTRKQMKDLKKRVLVRILKNVAKSAAKVTLMAQDSDPKCPYWHYQDIIPKIKEDFDIKEL